jgi:putative ATP-dependent endonuclease of OLD family
MWLERALIRNFRSIEDLTINFSPGINAIFGPNGTGKTNITRAILKLLGPSYPGQNSFSAEDHTLRDESRPIEIELSFQGNEGRHTLRWGQDRNGNWRLQSDGEGYVKTRQREGYCPLHFPSDRSVFEFPGHNKWNPIGRIIEELSDLVVGNESFRTGFEGKVLDLNAFLTTAPEYDAFRRKLIYYSKEHLGSRGDSIDVQMGVIDPRHILKTLQIFEMDGNARYNVADGGQGVQSSVTMAALRAFASVSGGRFFVIADEPEAYLHPLAQRSLALVFEELARGGTQVILTTHSPHFVSSDHIEGLHKIWMDGNRTKESPFDMGSLLRRQSSRGIQRGTPEGVKGRLSKILTLEAREALFAQLAVVCEGETESLSLPIWAGYEGHDFSKLGIAVVQSQGKFSMISLAEFYSSFNIPTYLVFDSDSDPRPSERAKHIEHNRWLIGYSGGVIEDFPATGAYPKYAVLSPNYESVVRIDPEYPRFEAEVNVELGLQGGSSKGVRARAVALRYKESNHPTPSIIRSIVRAIVGCRQSAQDPLRGSEPIPGL